MAEIPTNEYFPETDDTGKVILFHIYVDTFLLTEDGGSNIDNAIKYDSSDTFFIKTVTTKFRKNFISLLRSVTNSNCANLSADMLAHLFDEDANLYIGKQYKKSSYALLTDSGVKVSDFYTIDPTNNTITHKITDKTCNLAYFTFKLRFKYKLLDFVVQFELGNGIYQDSNEYNQNDTTINGNLTVTNDLTVNNNINISKNLIVSCNSTFAKNVTISGTTTMNETLTIGDACNTHDVRIYGGDENDDTYILWDSSASTLSLQGSFIIGSDVDITPNDGVSDNTFPVTFYSNTGKLEWLPTIDKLNITGNLDISKITNLAGDVNIGTNISGSNFTLWGSDSSGNQIGWDKSTDIFRIKGHLHHGDVGSGHTLQINSNSETHYINWNPDTYKLQINGNICIGEEYSGESFKVWGNDSGKYILWDNSSNKLSVIGNIDFGSVTDKQTLTLYGSVNTNEKSLIWDGPTGKLTNQGLTTLQGVTEIQNQLTIGELAGNHKLLVYGDISGKNLSWLDHKLSINGLLDVSDKTTLNGDMETNSDVIFKSSTVGKHLNWFNATNTLKITGTTELCGSLTVTTVDSSVVNINSNITLEKPVQINDTLIVGEDETEYNVKFYGGTTGNYLEWINNKLTVSGTVNITDQLTTSHMVNINSNDPNKSITWNHITNTLDVSGLSNFTDNCTFTKDIIIENTGTFELRGTDPANIYIKWDPDILTIKSNVDIYNNNLQLIDNDLIIKSCVNDFYVKWISESDQVLKVNAKGIFSGTFEINDDHLTPIKSIVWDGVDTLTATSHIIQTDHNMIISGDSSTFTLRNTANDNHVKWIATDNGLLTFTSDALFNFENETSFAKSDFSANKLYLNVDTEFNDNITITGTNSNCITWNKEILDSTAIIETHNNIILHGSGSCINDNITWTATTGTLVADATVTLMSQSTTCTVEWDNYDKLSINANLDFKKGDIRIYDSVAINNPIERITWDSSANLLTKTGSQLLLQNMTDSSDASYIKVHWNPADKLYITAPVQLDGILTTNNNITIKGTNSCIFKNITWVSETGVLNINGSVLQVQNISNFYNHLTVDADVTFNGCDSNHHLTWVNTTNTFKVIGTSSLDGDVLLDGNSGANTIAWNSTDATLTSNAKTVILNGDNTHSTKWDKDNNRLTVTGSIIKTPIPSDECGDVTLDMNNNNNFHITLTGNINLLNPINMCAGQEGRIVIKTGGTNRNISLYGTHWYFEDCISSVLSPTDTIDVLVYYVYSSTQILVKHEKNYIICPAPNC